MRQLPTGTVTFLFTDIEGSTQLLHELGDEYAGVLAEHHRLMRESFEPHGGVEVDTAGDAFFVAFRRASDAVAAAAAAQHALAPTGLRVRMGIHTGEPLLTETGYVGMDVHRAARVMSAGHGGQVLISQATRALLDDEFELADLGEHRLKDLSAAQRLWQLGSAKFPRLKTLHQTNLPVQPSSLVGRERELREAGSLLRSNRLVTLVGPGGSGKTRLALQLAAEAAEDFPDGVFWVPLQSISDPVLVLPAIAQALGAPESPAAFLGGKSVMLLLDNLEQVVEAATEIAGLLTDTTGVRVLATSREPLRIAGEQRFAVDPLPDADAVALFLDRARSVDPSLAPGPAVAEICRRLDRLPLALELAAARVSLLDPETLLARLNQALPLLTGGARDAPERQQTLRATVEWSYELLDEEERRLFAALAVFAGSFDLEAATAVCEAGLDTLQSLVDKSLLRRWGSGRFGMLETIHEFARERLATDDAARARELRHAEHFLDVARGGNFSARATGEEDTELGRLEAGNFRSAIQFALEQGEVELGLRIATALERWWTSADPFEGARTFEALLAAGADVSPEVRAGALRAYGGAKYMVGDFAPAVELYEQSLDLYGALGDEWGEAHLLHRLAVEAVRVSDLERARRLTDRALAVSVRLADHRGIAMSETTLAQVAEKEGDDELAIQLYGRGARTAGENGFTWWEGLSLLSLAEVHLRIGRLDEAMRAVAGGLAAVWKVGDRQNTVFGLAMSATIAAREGRLADAGALWGAVEAEASRGAIGQWEDARETCWAELSEYADHDFERGREAGRRLTLSEAVESALA